MNKINKKEFLVLSVGTDNNSSPIVSLYFPDVEKKTKKFSLANKEYYDFFVKKCELTKRKILYYQETNQDQDIIEKYLIGCKNFKTKFHNIKDYFLINKYFKFASKNNLCLGLGINNNSGLKQEWAIFEKINGEFCYCKNKDDKGLCILYSLTKQYYFPVSEVNNYLNIDRIINLPNLEVTFEEVFAFDLSADLLLNFQPKKDCAKDDGKILEDMIAKSLNAIDVKDRNFCTNNKKKLIKLGEFSYEPVLEDKEYQAEVKKVAEKIKSKINKLIIFIKKKIFQSQKIKTQELIVNDQLKIFGYADFSNDHAVLEMKFIQNYSKINDTDKINNYINRYKYQLYITAKERPVYLLIGSYEKFLILEIKFKIINSKKNKIDKSKKNIVDDQKFC